jgi:uncharacterized protein (DUF1330 family)
MAVYVIGAVLSVSDPEKFSAYQQSAGQTLAQYGGKILGGGTNVEVADGTWSPIGMVVVEFESMAKAKEWYNSPEYSAIKSQRFDNADTGLVFLDAS